MHNQFLTNYTETTFLAKIKDNLRRCRSYVGKGKLLNCRKTDNGNGTYLFDISMVNELPDYLQYDFGLTK